MLVCWQSAQDEPYILAVVELGWVPAQPSLYYTSRMSQRKDHF